ncbi:antibiotic biosynthesis monooxygenase [Novosphingobium lentum]|uniref:antibiotic biosynthesis monooxygenase n=1 Tax=Novosphingobium lentum TaxID=145287 RepID=UPI00082AD40A|nr:antibiotic biosynthesis monooxygenase [Novosphingobium lentum]
MEKIYGFVPIAIAEGQTDAFIAGAQGCHEAALADLTGTQAYEWFLSADGREAYVIEVYDDPAAVAHHSKMMDGRVAKLRDIAKFEITFAGNVPQMLQDRMADVLGDVEYAGPLAFGRMTEATPHRTPPAGDDRIYALAWFRPKQGMAAKLRDLARQAFDKACAADPGTHGYEWFFADDGSCMALDIYHDGAAMLAHMANCGPIMGQILAIAEARTIVFGALPPELESRLRPELGITRFARRLHGVA